MTMAMAMSDGDGDEGGNGDGDGDLPPVSGLAGLRNDANNVVCARRLRPRATRLLRVRGLRADYAKCLANGIEHSRATRNKCLHVRISTVKDDVDDVGDEYANVDDDGREGGGLG